MSQSPVDILNDRQAGPDTFRNIMCTGISHAGFDSEQPAFQFGRIHPVDFTGCQAQFVSGSGQADGPHAGVATFLNVADGVPDFHHGFQGINL